VRACIAEAQCRADSSSSIVLLDHLEGIAGRQPSVTAAEGRASLQVALAAIRPSELGTPVRPAIVQ